MVSLSEVIVLNMGISHGIGIPRGVVSRGRIMVEKGFKCIILDVVKGISSGK